MRIVGILFVFLNLVFSSANVYAENIVNAISADLKYNDINERLNKVDKNIQNRNVNHKQLNDDVLYLRETRIKLEGSRQDIEKSIQQVEKRLEALGVAPEDGNEIALIAQKRKEFNQELAQERARLSEADLLLARIEEIELQIFNLRHQELWGNLLESSEPLIYPQVLYSSVKMLFGLVADVITSPLNWYQQLSDHSEQTVKYRLMTIIFSAVLLTLIGWGLRRVIMRKYGYLPDIEHPRFGRKLIAAFLVWCAYGVIPVLIIGFLLFWVINSEFLLNNDFGKILSSFLYYSLFIIIVKASCRVIFTPYNERWRLINISTYKAKKVTLALYLSVFMIGIISFLTKVVEILNYPIELMSLMLGIGATLKAFCIVWVLHCLLWDDAPVNTSDEITESESEIIEDEENNFSLKVSFISVLVAISILGLSLFGYPYLASFISDRIIMSIVLGLVFIGIRKFVKEALHRVLFFKFWFKTFRVRRGIIRRLDFWFGFFIDPLLVISGMFIFLAIWGVPTEVLYKVVYRLFTGFMIGDIKISLLSIIFGILAFFILIGLVKYLRQKLENGLLSRMEMEDGTRHSLAAGFSSIGYVASALIAIIIMGGNLTSLALVAGALSVGIGLGLQNVVNNFVSGIILLFERPVKVGDWVIINGEEGRIKQINIRSTEMETFKKSSLIIPNADLLSTTVTNLTHGNNWSRQAVSVGVAYGCDTEKVRDILLECARNHKKVLRKPEPYVIFKDFGASSLDFELRCYTNDIWSGWTIPSDLRFEINKRFAEEGIEIPFQQIVVHTGSQVAGETVDMFYASKRKGKKNAD